MALLKFKKGLFKQLPATKAEGTVYITSDTREMYVDVDASTRISISGLRIVANEAALTALGAEGGEGYSTQILYFVEDTKALKKYNGSGFDYLNDTSDLAELGKTVAAHTTAIANLGAKDDELETAIGNINASNVDTTQKIVVTKAVGNYAVGKEIDINTSVQDLLLNMLSQDVKASVKTKVSMSTTLSNSGAIEVGTVFTPSATIATNPGLYTANGKDQATKITFSNYKITESGTISAASDGVAAVTRSGSVTGSTTGSFDSFTVTDTTNYKVTGSCNHTQGDMPKSYLGNDNADVRIAAGSLSAVSGSVTGYRNWFYGYKTAANKLDTSNLTSAQIRALTEQNGGLAAKLDTTGMQQMFFAIPAGKKNSVTVANAVNGAPCTVSKTTVKVEGANGFTAIDYDVWYVDNSSADSGSNSYKITVS